MSNQTNQTNTSPLRKNSKALTVATLTLCVPLLAAGNAFAHGSHGHSTNLKKSHSEHAHHVVLDRFDAKRYAVGKLAVTKRAAPRPALSPYAKRRALLRAKARARAERARAARRAYLAQRAREARRAYQAKRAREARRAYWAKRARQAKRGRWSAYQPHTTCHVVKRVEAVKVWRHGRLIVKPKRVKRLVCKTVPTRVGFSFIW